MSAPRLASVVALCAFLSPPSAAQEEVARPDQGFRVELPEGWTQREATQGAIFALVLQPEGGDGTLSVTVRVVGSGAIGGLEGALASVRDAVAAAGEQYSDLREVERELAGAEARGLDFLAHPSPGTTLGVRQALREEHGKVFVVQTVAPEGDRKHRRLLRRVVESFTLLEPAPEDAEQARLRELAARCGSELDWAGDWEEAEARARERDCLVLVVAKMTVGFEMSDALMVGAFMEPEVVELVRERYVPFELRRGMAVPFADPELYGLSKTSFGTCLMLVTPDGEVVGESVVSVLPFLVRGLDAHADWPGPAAEVGPVERGERLLLRGELEAAWDVLKEHRTARAHLLRARLFRWRRDDNAMHAELTEAEAAGRREGDAGVELEVARFLADARGVERWIEEHPDHERVPEARWWLGHLRFADGESEAAEEAWRALVDERPESRWAWRAAGSLTSTAFAMGRRPRTGPPPRATLGLPLRPAYEALPVAEVGRAADQAVRWLLNAQRPDGTWFTPSEAGRAPGEADDLALATAAIAAQGMLHRRGAPDVAAAVEAALEAVLDEHARVRALDAPLFFMDYGSWSRPYLLWLVADCLAAGVGDRERLEAVAPVLVAEIAGKQKPGGGWSYYVTSDVTSGGGASAASISCNTAAAVLALQRAREVGLEVPAELLERGLDCLEAMRNANGTFEYMLHPGQGGGQRGTGRPGAAGRGPACTLALVQGGRAELDDLRESLEIFVAHGDELAREGGKAIMHAGADGQGSHYLTFDWCTAAMAVAALPASERAPFREAVLRLLLRSRTPEGAYVDNPIVGRAAGTGLALRAFHELAADA